MDASLDSKPHVSYKFEVEKIIDISIDGSYQVQWAPAWVSKFHLVGCEHLIEEFLQSKQQIEEDAAIHPDSPFEGPATAKDVDIKPALDDQLEESDMIGLGNAREEMLLQEETEIKFEPEIQSNEEESSDRDDDVRDGAILLPLTGAMEVTDEYANLQGDEFRTIIQSTIFDSPPKVTVMDTLTMSNSKAHNELEPQSGISTDIYKPSDLNNVTTLNQQLQQKLNKCRHCFMDFEDEGRFDDHVCKDRKRDGHACKYCDYSCSKKSNLIIHIRKHTGEKPYSCDQCNYSSARRSNLTVHMRLHTGEKPYSCNICGKSFSQLSDRKKHLRTHTCDKPYSCDVCCTSFTQASSLNRHKRRCSSTVVRSDVEKH